MTKPVSGSLPEVATSRESDCISKKTMRQSYIKFKRFNIKKLRNMKSTNPKSYWKIINGGKQEAVQASVENLFAFF